MIESVQSCIRFSKCGFPGCSEIIPLGTKRCKLHKHIQFFNVDKDRTIIEEPPYSKDWNKIQQNYLRKNPHCERCGKTQTVVHHLTNDYIHNTNLQALCQSCHNSINAKRQQLYKYEKEK